MAGNKSKDERYLYMLPDEVFKLLDTAYEYDKFYGVLFEVTFYGGLRISETLMIRPMDIIPDKNEIRIFTLKQKDKNKLKQVSLLFPEKTIENLKNIINSSATQESRIFNITRQQAWSVFKKMLIFSELSEEYSPHALRHAHGIIVSKITSGNVVNIAKRLRHSSLNYVSKYTHLTDEMQKEIIEGMEKLKTGRQL